MRLSGSSGEPRLLFSSVGRHEHSRTGTPRNAAEQAIDDDRFAGCMEALGPFENSPLLAIAVSGGPDSLALTLLSDRWARRRGGRVVGLTVDHGLRATSGDDARLTGRWLNARGIEHHHLVWQCEKPRTGLQRRARDARYALLADWCRQHRCLHLLTAHHLQDQAETVAMRKARQSGEAGLAGMATIREISGLRLLRPLLDVNKSALIGTLMAARQPWIDDPSNQSMAFTRNRLRKSGLDVAALTAEAEERGAGRAETDRQLAAALVRHTILDLAGFAWLDAKAFAWLPIDLAQALLSRLLVTVGGGIYPPRGRSLLRLLRTLRSNPGAAEDATGSCLAHCRILPMRGRWLICREIPSLPEISLPPGETRHWDDRFMITLTAPITALKIQALGDTLLSGRNRWTTEKRSRQLPSAVKRSLPAIWLDRTLIAVPHLNLYGEGIGPDNLDLRFCPLTPLANAPFMPHISGL